MEDRVVFFLKTGSHRFFRLVSFDSAVDLFDEVRSSLDRFILAKFAQSREQTIYSSSPVELYRLSKCNRAFQGPVKMCECHCSFFRMARTKQSSTLDTELRDWEIGHSVPSSDWLDQTLWTPEIARQVMQATSTSLFIEQRAGSEMTLRHPPERQQNFLGTVILTFSMATMIHKGQRERSGDAQLLLRRFEKLPVRYERCSEQSLGRDPVHPLRGFRQR
ncbi:hypothetical protein GYMLUDRAFT_436741 [Collybiopsis luxurians FD-317 M1]|uniref:Unplaced genomic scaffold GYMLUscaffold_14, whole genome shotgun sequence n=1 Tax=Collybiopsis luxurians FD-317 M1 TaxID=944289 RepID=A0A0D0BJ70_9AGAR|nr:hypothetical protein GYMLUDRAFT_436741 [Collybiopsis luxurians FD-317 M1]